MILTQNFFGSRSKIIGAALLALFLGALDTLIISAAMPTIISELGGLKLYAWVYSAYFLSRAISLPLFGKLSDLFPTKKLFLFSISLFVLASISAGASPSMGCLVSSRIFQGIGAGGVFALVYVVLSDVSTPGQRAKTLSLGGTVWGLASLIGPAMGGFIVTWFSWRWIFFINLPLGILSFAGIAICFKEVREKPKQVSLDWTGAIFLTAFIIVLLKLAMVGGQNLDWKSFRFISLIFLTIVLGVSLYQVEKRAKDPIIDFKFFKLPAFALGNFLVFCSSFAIFSLFAYAPLFLQGALSKSPLQVGYGLLFLSLGWSMGSFSIGRAMHSVGRKGAAIMGTLLMVFGNCMALFFSGSTSMIQCVLSFFLIGIGMGFVTLSTLLIVQDSLNPENLGVATSFHQFSRSLGGTIGVGVCGGFVTTRIIHRIKSSGNHLPDEIFVRLKENMAILFQEEFYTLFPEATISFLRNILLESLFSVFIMVFSISLLGLILAFFLPSQTSIKK